MASVRRTFTEAQKADILAFAAAHTVDKAVAKFKVHASSIYSWKAKLRPSGATAEHNQPNSPTAKSNHHAVILLLRQSKRAAAEGKLIKAQLLASLALEELEGR